MRKMRMILACLMCALMPQMAKASDYPYLVFTNTEGTTLALSVANMQLSVKGSELTVTNAEGTNVFTLTGLAAMQFSQDGSLTAIENVLNAAQPVEVFSVTGSRLASFASLQEAVQSISTGVYVVKQGSKSQTIVVR